MLPFQNTGIYKETIALFEDLQKSLSHDAVFSTKIRSESLEVTTALAKILAKEKTEERQAAFEKLKENFYGLFSLLEIGMNQNLISTEQYHLFTQKLTNIQNNLLRFSQIQKRILILSANAGQGHMSAAKAIKQGFEYLYGYDADIEIVDFGAILSSTINKATIKAYEGSIKYIPSVYEFLFESTNKKWQIKLLNLLNYPLSFNKLTKFFKDKQPDLILSTHPVWDYIALKIWKKQNPSAKFVSIITDSISIHKAWVVADTDYQIVANKDTAQSLKELGVEKEKIKILGFPVKLDFLEKTDRKNFLEAFALNSKNFTILFLATSESKQKATKTIVDILHLKENFNLIVITGNNEKLRSKIAHFEKNPQIRIFGWTDRLGDFMKSSDVVITKAGGATIMECIAAQKPMIITQIIPGQEEGNAEFIERHRLGIIASKLNPHLTENIKKIQKNKSVFQKNLARYSNPRSALDIARFIQGIIK